VVPRRIPKGRVGKRVNSIPIFCLFFLAEGNRLSVRLGVYRWVAGTKREKRLFVFFLKQ